MVGTRARENTAIAAAGPRTQLAPDNVLARSCLGTEKDEKQAIALYSSAARRGFSKAQFNLAIYLMEGVGVEKDEAKAIEWFGHAEAREPIAGLFKRENSATERERAAVWNRRAPGFAKLSIQARRQGESLLPE